ncbi:MAG: Fe-S oxidoreductase, partial [Pseudonocardia sp.]|nr:Fe-S oxidoreductase [Pseudonocardia sp.]
MTALTLVVVGRRAYTIYSLIMSGQPDHARKDQVGERLKRQFVEVFGQQRLLKWSVPGLAHFFTFWAFVLLLTVYIEAYGALYVPDFA